MFFGGGKARRNDKGGPHDILENRPALVAVGGEKEDLLWRYAHSKEEDMENGYRTKQ